MDNKGLKGTVVGTRQGHQAKEVFWVTINVDTKWPSLTLAHTLLSILYTYVLVWHVCTPWTICRKYCHYKTRSASLSYFLVQTTWSIFWVQDCAAFVGVFHVMLSAERETYFVNQDLTISYHLQETNLTLGGPLSITDHINWMLD